MPWRAAVKLAYDGREFFGSQRQPDVSTVEEEILECLIEIKAIDSPKGARFRAASRTDRGVSAVGNVVAFDTAFRKEALLRAMNAASERVHYYGIAEVPEAFSPRRATRRWYRYFLPQEGLELGRVMQCAELFVGKHDFRNFCKVDERSTIRSVEKVETFPVGDFIIADFFAREFLRNMIRRMVAAMAEVGAGNSDLQSASDALDGKRNQFGLAPAGNLCLMDVQYPFEFHVERPPTLKRKLRTARERNFVEMAFLDALKGELTKSE